MKQATEFILEKKRSAKVEEKKVAKQKRAVDARKSAQQNRAANDSEKKATIKCKATGKNKNVVAVAWGPRKN